MRRSVFSLLVVASLGGCQDLTAVTPERVPPPDREVVDDGTLDDSTDPCGALDIEPPRRLSATPGDSDGVRVALLPRPGGETWVGVAWLEHGTEGPDETSTSQVALQVLLEDGVSLGVTAFLPAGTPVSVDLVPVIGTSSFVVATADFVAGSSLRVISPSDAQADGPTEPSLEVPLAFDSPRIVLNGDRGLVVGLSLGPDTARPAALSAVTISDTVVEVTTGVLPGVVATDLAIAASGGSTWLAWNDGTTVWGASLRETSPGTWEIVDDSKSELGPLEGPLWRAHGTTELAVATSVGGLMGVYRLEQTEWRPLGIGDDDVLSEGLAATRGESGARWAIARATAPAGGGPREVHVQRFRTAREFCAAPGECARVTTDLQDSSAPDIVAVANGYLVAWSDAIDGGQTDVFVASARCHSTTEP